MYLECHLRAEEARRQGAPDRIDEDLRVVTLRNADASQQPPTVREATIRSQINRMYKEVYKILYSRLTTDHDKARLRSQACVGTGGVLAWMGGPDPRFFLAHGAFTYALRERFMLHPSYDAADNMRECHCGVNVADMLEGHAWSCDRNAGLRTACHNAITDALATLLRKNTEGAQVEKSRQYERRDAPGAWVESDLEYVTPHERISIDVSCVDPGSHTSRTLYNSANVTGAAAAARERVKHSHYQHALMQGGAHKLVPIVFETTGRLGVEAIRFLDTVFPPTSQGYGKFLAHVSAIMARYGARMVEASWGRMAGE